MSAGDPLAALRAVFDAVRAGRKERAALGTPFLVLGVHQLRIQELVGGKYGDAKPFAKQRIGNELRANALVPVVQQKAFTVYAVAALPFYKGIDFPALRRRQPLHRTHASSAA